MRDTLLKFIENNRDLIDNDKWEDIYSKLGHDFSTDVVRKFTSLLLRFNFNPLNYMSYIPDRFLYKSNIKNFNIPDGIKKIGIGAFSECKQLRNIKIPKGVRLISLYAFWDCISLESITLPISVAEIHAFAFYGCRKLKNIYYEGSEEDWNRISMTASNDSLRKANIHFNNYEGRD